MTINCDTVDGYHAGDMSGAQEAWITPTLLNSWVNFGGGYSTVGYYKDSLGIVHVKGIVKSGTAVGIFVLPAGYRPVEILRLPTFTNGVFGWISIDTAGDVNAGGGYSNVSFALDVVNFKAV